MLEQYIIDPNTVKCIRKIYRDTTSHVLGANKPFQMTIGVKQGFLQSSLAFRPLFDRVVSYVA